MMSELGVIGKHDNLIVKKFVSWMRTWGRNKFISHIYSLWLIPGGVMKCWKNMEFNNICMFLEVVLTVAIHNREQLASRFFTEGSYWWLCFCVHAGYWEAISSKRDINLLMWWLGVRTSCEKWRMLLVIWFLVNLFIYEKNWDQVFFFNLNLSFNLRMTPLQIVRILHLKLL